jgi:hypothetical protein
MQYTVGEDYIPSLKGPVARGHTPEMVVSRQRNVKKWFLLRVYPADEHPSTKVRKPSKSSSLYKDVMKPNRRGDIIEI